MKNIFESVSIVLFIFSLFVSIYFLGVSGYLFTCTWFFAGFIAFWIFRFLLGVFAILLSMAALSVVLLLLSQHGINLGEFFLSYLPNLFDLATILIFLSIFFLVIIFYTIINHEIDLSDKLFIIIIITFSAIVYFYLFFIHENLIFELEEIIFTFIKLFIPCYIISLLYYLGSDYDISLDLAKYSAFMALTIVSVTPICLMVSLGLLNIILLFSPIIIPVGITSFLFLFPFIIFSTIPAILLGGLTFYFTHNSIISLFVFLPTLILSFRYAWRFFVFFGIFSATGFFAYEIFSAMRFAYSITSGLTSPTTILWNDFTNSEFLLSWNFTDLINLLLSILTRFLGISILILVVSALLGIVYSISERK